MRVAVTLLFLCVGLIPIRAAQREYCRIGALPIKRIQGFEINLRPYDDPKENEEGCRATVRDSNHRIVFSASDWDIERAPIKGAENSSQAPYVVLEGYSGGAHCCWTYYIISLRDRIGLVKKFFNERGARFTFERNTRRLEIQTLDGAFDYFDSWSHAETPFPDVYLRLVGERLVDVSREHQSEYNDVIKEAKQKLDPSTLTTLKKAKNRGDLVAVESNRRAAPAVLMIVFAYLYSGRRTHARQALAEMWPAFDQHRLWALILKTRRQGVLRYASPGTAPLPKPGGSG